MRIRNINLLFVFFSFSALAGEISFSFDDAPRSDGNLYTGAERTKIIIEKLKKYNIQTVFFVNSENFVKDNGIERIKAYVDNGHIIANHTHSHPNLNKVDIGVYKEDLLKAHGAIKELSTFKPWFRFPYLKRGKTKEKRDEIRKFLKDNNYLNAYITIDNYDWSMDRILQENVKLGLKFSDEKICKAYSNILWDSIKYYDDMAIKYLKRSPKHVMLLHENDIAALCLDAFIKKIVLNNWKIITPQDSYRDEVAKRDPDTLYLGQGRIAALIEEKSGIKIRSHWQDTKLLKEEFERMKIFK